MTDADNPAPPSQCSACRGSGSVISNLGGSPQTLDCPWCDGSGIYVQGHDAQAHWRQQEPTLDV